MIKNWLQYRITAYHWQNFRNELLRVSETSAPPEIEPAIWEAQKAALLFRISEFENEMREWEKFWSSVKEKK